jgi:hypothetical protein
MGDNEQGFPWDWIDAWQGIGLPKPKFRWNRVKWKFIDKPTPDTWLRHTGDWAKGVWSGFKGPNFYKGRSLPSWLFGTFPDDPGEYFSGFVGTVAGMSIGGMMFGPVGVTIGGFVGGRIGVEIYNADIQRGNWQLTPYPNPTRAVGSETEESDIEKFIDAVEELTQQLYLATGPEPDHPVNTEHKKIQRMKLEKEYEKAREEQKRRALSDLSEAEKHQRNLDMYAQWVNR